jgi:S1-C subfamily serine protease
MPRPSVSCPRAPPSVAPCACGTRPGTWIVHGHAEAADTVDTVRGDLLDLALVVAAVAFAISGYRQGFIVGSLSFVGFVGGAVLGAEYGPAVSRAIVGGQTQQDVVAVILLVSGAIVGQFVFSSIGAYVRQSMTSPSSTTADSVGGSAVSVLSMLLIAWAIGSVLTASSFPVVVRQVDESVVLGTMDKVMPSQAKTMFSEFRRLLASGPFPQVFSGIGAAHLFAISPPDPAVLKSPGYLAAISRVVKVDGTALSCDRSIEGSGFVYAPQHVLTNAHVVAGVTQGLTVTTRDGKPHPARVVLYDPQVDIAVLDVPGLDLPPLHFDSQAQPGDSAVVAGYPLDHPFTGAPARIGGTQNAVGPDIYQTGQVDRQIFEVRAQVLPGNSGGPLLSPDGTVYGVVFAAAVGTANTGFALTAAEVATDASNGANQTIPHSTQGCD